MMPLSSWLVIGSWLVICLFIGLGLAYFFTTGDDERGR